MHRIFILYIVVYTHMKESIPELITNPELEAIEDLFKADLAPSPINLEYYRNLCETDEVAEELLIDMVRKCLEYAVNVSNMERYVREHKGERDEDREEVDNKRTITHNATMDSINIFSRYIVRKLNESSIVTWDSGNRGAYGRFAILLTLNTFKEKIILDVMRKKTSAGELDISRLREKATPTDLLVLDYVDILCTVEKEHRTLNESEQKKLIEIELKLNQTSEKILEAFYKIYTSRY